MMTRALNNFRRWLCLGLVLSALPTLAQAGATLTVADGKPLLLRGAATFSVVAGARLDAGDMLETGAGGQAQLEFADGLILNLGPDSKLYLLPQVSGKPMDVALAAGWLKAAIPAGRKGEARNLRYLLPGFEIETSDATVVLHAAMGLSEVFAENGSIKVSEVARDGTPGKTLTAKGSDYASRQEEQAATVARPPTTFLAGMPRNYRDNLPPLVAKAKIPPPEPVRDHDTSYAEAKAWLNADAPVRNGLVARYQARSRDTEFRSGLAAEMNLHPEWERVLGAKGAKNK
jgi:FecR-like protein